MEFLFGFGGFFFPFGFLLLGAVVLAATAIVGRRTTPDPTGRRPMAIYLLSVMFIALFTTASAVAQIGGTLANLVQEERGIPPPLPPPIPAPIGTLEPVEEIQPESRGYVAPEFLTAPQDRTLSQVLRAGLVGLLGLTIFEFHRRRWSVLLRKESTDG
jgi:hypothetical protein